MAEFILGRIKFVYRNNWVDGTAYVVDDVVTAGGRTYICIKNHTSSTLFETDYDPVAALSKWNLVADGQQWRGDWVAEQYYNAGDLVKYGGNVYQCNTAHTSATYVSPTYLGLEQDAGLWDLFATSFNWLGAWSYETRYKVNDLVTYGGYTYVCTTKHISASTSVTITATGFSVGAGTGTLSFANQGVAPFSVGSTITLAGFTPSATSTPSNINTTHTVVSCSPTQVTFAITGTYTVSVLGTVTGTSLLGLETDSGKWETFNAGLEYQGDWTTNTRYKTNDIVKWGSDLWICLAPHLATSFISDSSKWEIFVNGFQFENSWNIGTTYQIGDTVTYGGYSYIAKTNNVGLVPTENTADWAVYTTGFNFQGDWANNVSYKIGSVVREHGYTYLSLVDSPSYATVASDTSAATDLITVDSTAGFVAGMEVISDTSFGNIVAGKKYYVLSSGLTSTEFKISETPGGTALQLSDTTTQSANLVVYPYVENISYWVRLNPGLQWTNNSTTYSNVAGSNVVSLGSGATFDIVRSGTVYSVSIHAGSSGANYAVGDTIKVVGTDIGGLSPVNDLVITVSSTLNGAITGVTWAGISSTWKSGTVYTLGDLVLFGANNYICIASHAADNTNRPDADTTALYWNLFSAGAESATLTTEGDTFFYGPNGPTRLPIGADGQVLRVSNGYPVWETYGHIFNVVYVSPTGQDLPYPTAGFSIDQPWKSIRYACKQVEEGYRNPEAKAILQRNKQFLIKEINNYIIYTYRASVTGSNAGAFTTSDTAGLNVNMPIQFSNLAGSLTIGGSAINTSTTYYVKAIVADTSFTISATPGGVALGAGGTGTAQAVFSYDSDKAERDAGLVIEGLTFDLSHGGTQKTTANTLAFYDTSGTAYITTLTRYQITQFIGSHVYLKSLIANVLNNTAPAVNYQSLNAETDVAYQEINVNFTAEADSNTTVQGLLDILIAGLSAGNTSEVPASLNPNTTISVKTGTYTEVLPIVVPANTAIVGDELRSSVVQPKPANDILINDKTKTISSLSRVKALIPSIVSNTPVVPSSGNTATQQYLFTNNDTAATSSITSNTATMVSILENGLKAVPSYTLPIPTSGSNNAYTAGYADAARLVRLNKEFLKAEVSAWINVQIAGNTAPFVGFVYDQIPCERDVGYIVDALSYDLTYGGNLATVIAARSYYSNGVLVETGEKTQALALWAYVKTIIDDIVTKTAITPSSGNTLTQDTSGLAGSAGASSAAVARIQELYDTINTGTDPVTIAPDITWPSAAKISANTNIQAAKSAIQANTLAWIANAYPDLSYNTTLCNRDVGYIVDALCYDMLFGSNFLSSWNAMSYYRALSSTSTVRNKQFDAQVGMIGFISSSLKEYTGSTTGSAGSFVALSRVTSSAEIIYDIVNTGLTAVPSFQFNNPTGYNTSYLATFGDGKQQIIQNYDFIVADVLQYYANGAYSGVWSSTTTEGRDKGKRDIKYILDALQHDMTYGGNYQTLVAGSAYYSSYLLNISAAEKPAFIDLFGFMKTLIGKIVRREAITAQSGNTVARVSTGSAGNSTAGTFAENRIQDVIDWITNGSAPASVAIDTSWAPTHLQTAYAAVQAKRTEIALDATGWVQKFYQSVPLDLTLTERDAGLVVDAIAYDMVLGTNFNAISAGRAYQRGTTSTLALLNGAEKNPSLGAINFIKYKVKNIAASGAVAQLQTTFDDIVGSISGGAGQRLNYPKPELPAGSYSAVSGTNLTGSGSSATFNFVRTAAGFTASVSAGGTGYAAGNTIKILGSNIGGATPANDIVVTVLTVSTGAISTISVSTFNDAVVQLEDNRNFIIEEVIAYLDYTYPQFIYDKATCSRDVGYIIDALGYDLMFGSNFASIKAGMSYYRAAASAVVGSQKTATIAAFTYLKSLAITAVTGNATAVTSVTNNMDEIIDIITNGLSSANAFTLPTPTGGTGNAFTAGYANAARLINANRSFIIAELTAWINVQKAGNVSPFTSTFLYNKVKCERDVGYIVDALRYDLTYGGNLQTTVAARSYFSGVTAQYGSGELEETLATYAYLKTIVADIAQKVAITPSSGNSLTQDVSGTAGSLAAADVAQGLVQAIYDTINTNGVLPTETAPDTSWVDSGLVSKNTALQSAKSTIRGQVIDYIDTNYPAFVYSKDLAKRDAGYILDAIHYDLTYGGDFASQQAGQAYYSFTTSEISDYVKTATLDAISRLSTVAQSVVQNTAVSATYGNTGTQIFKNGAQIAGSAYSATVIGSLITKIYNYVNSGLTSGAPTITITAIATLNTFTSNAHGLANGDLVEPQSTTNGLTSGVKYYVVGATTNTFQLASTYNGTALATFTNGSGLSIVAHKTNMPYLGWVSSSLVQLYTTLSGATSTLQDEVITYIDSNYQNLNYSATLARRDAAAAIDAVCFDLMFNSNYRGIKAGQAYVRPQSSALLGSLYLSTTESLKYLQTRITNSISSNSTGITRANATMSIIINHIRKGASGETPEMTGTTTYNINNGIIVGANILRANIEFLANESTAWVDSNFGGTVTNTTESGSLFTTSLAHNLEVGDPVLFTYTPLNLVATKTVSSSKKITLNSVNGIVVGMPVTFSGTVFGGVSTGVTYFVESVSGSQITISTTNGGAAGVVNADATGIMGANVNGVLGGVIENQVYYVLSTPTTTTFTVTATQFSSTVQTVSTMVGSMTARYAYDKASCQRDMTEFLNAIIYDIQYTGNYKSKRAAELYLNAINGSELSNMWLVRNSTGIRNMTLTGLTGPLSVPNVYGTKRPEGGSYTSLDPGFGPYDTNAWVSSRSCYVQNCSLFGTGATALKIDGALHAGGNRSIVANDYTTFISDGIGVWCTGANSLTELVSVFAYYSYAGYIAELGGRIRATNGNSSYGTYGVIAEGVDTYETPLYATLNNRGEEAYITNVVTDGTDEVLRIEFANAGTNYTNATWTISGSGYNAAATGDEFRDYGVFETRLTDLNDGYGYGGTGYVTAANAAQLSSTGYITLAASDTQLSTAYVGMRVLVTAGTGAGQYGAILTYNNGSKVAKVFKESFTPLTATATTGASDLITVSSNVTLYADMPIYFSGTAFGNLTSNTLYYVKALTGSTQFTVYTNTSTKATVDLADGSGTLTLYAAGWDHSIPGKTIDNNLDLTTTYIIEPRITYSAPGYTATARTLATTAAWQSVTYSANTFLAIPNATAATTYSANGTTWSGAGNLPSTGPWQDVVYGGGEGATATAVVGGMGGIGAQLTAVLGSGLTAGQVVDVIVVNGGYGYLTAPTLEFISASGSGASYDAIVLDGEIVGVNLETGISGSGYLTAPTVNVRTDVVTEIIVNTWGKNYTSAPTVTISTPGNVSTSAWAATTSVTNGTYLITDTNYIYLVTGSGTTGATKPTHTSGSATNGSATLQFYGRQASVAAFGLNTLTDSILTNNGVSQLVVASGGGLGYTSTPTITIIDTNAKFIAIPTTASGGTTKVAYQTVSGAISASAWSQSSGSLPNGTYSGITYGSGYWVAVGGASTATRSFDGQTWSPVTIPTLGAGTYSGVSYGNGVFVAIATGSNVTAVSTTSGNSWTAGGNMPSSTTWTSVAYGNGRFVAIASNSTAVAYSINNGTNWLASPAGLPASVNWTKVTYGQGLFMAVASGTATCATSPDGVTWTLRAMPSSSNWKSIAFGNPAVNGTSVMPIFAAISNTSGQVGASIRTGATAQGRVKVGSGSVTEIRMIEPGSGYPRGNITATTTSTNIITTSDTTNLVDSQPVEFTGLDAYGLVTNTTYYVIGSTIVSNTSFKVSATAGSSTPINLTTGTSLSGTYKAGPIVTQTDPNKTRTAPTRVRLGIGALANPSFSNRGTANTTATANVSGDGYSDLYQASNFVNVAGLFSEPTAGANVEFASIPGTWFKLVQVNNLVGSQGNYTATFQINPALSVLNAPAHGDRVTTRLKYSQVRLTGHDFLYIGTGNTSRTNYPEVDVSLAVTANQTLGSNGGRVFFTSTDQDGNFNVGNLFAVQQATGTATLNASAFNLSGLQSLQLGTVSVGAGSAVITSFSTDPYFTANSDNILPTQKAVKSYITAQIGGGQSSLNVNTLTSGVIYVANNTISTTTGVQINVKAKMYFMGGVDGAPVALAYFMQK